MLKKFWLWYERHYKINVQIAAFAFGLQLVHLLWLTVDVVVPRAFGTAPLFEHARAIQFFIVLVDYIEVPSLISVSLVYIHDLRKAFSWKAILYLLFLNIQWLHIFWITDEFVVASLTGTAPVALTPSFAWVAILIDYLEIPVIIDTFRTVYARGWLGFRENKLLED